MALRERFLHALEHLEARGAKRLERAGEVGVDDTGVALPGGAPAAGAAAAAGASPARMLQSASREAGFAR